MTEDNKIATELDTVDAAALAELTRRVQDIGNSYRAVAEKMGQLYMLADEHKVSSLTEGLDKPMRNASDNEQMFTGMLEELQAFALRPKP